MIEVDTLAFVIQDAYPVSAGHALVIPRRHVMSWFECSAAEHLSLLDLLNKARLRLQALYSPHGFNIGVNDGVAAGQTIPHVHLHLIPRYAGDRDDPRGGIRWVLPEKAVYWDTL